MKILVAGTGSIGKRHIHNLLALCPEASFILHRANKRADEFSIRLGAQVVDSFVDALNQKPAAIIIATPSASHADLLLPAVSSGLPIYIEKPVVTERKDLEAIQTELNARNYRIPTLVGCNLRFLKSLQTLQQILLGGSIGRVVRASFEAGQWLPDWRPSQDYRTSYSAGVAGGGVIFDLIHELDSARWLLGEMTSVVAMTAQVPSLEIASEGVAGILMRSSDGAIVNVALDYVARRPVRRYQLIGEKGTLTWNLVSRTLQLSTPQEDKTIILEESSFDVSTTYRLAMLEFISAIQTGRQTSQPLEEGLRSSELAIRIKETTCHQG